MKGKFLLFCISMSFLFTGCNIPTFTFEDAKALAGKVAQQHDKQAWDTLVQESESSDVWNRFFALEFIVQLVDDKQDLDRNKAIELFIVALNDPQNSNIGLEGLIATGSDGVASAFNKIAPLVLSRKDNSDSWYATEALGLLTNLPEAAKATETLGGALLFQTPNENIPGAPRLRDMALKSLANIGQKNPVLVRSELEKVLPKLDAEYARKAADLIRQLRE